MLKPRAYKKLYSSYIKNNISFQKSIIYCALFIILSSFFVTDKNEFTYLIQTKLENYSTLKWPEKVYVQTDKSFYTTDETIWFSAYLVNGITHQKSTKSKVVYVELINDKDSIVEKRKLFVETVSTAGDFKINETWKEGKYVLRAYTNYMRNESSDYFFKKEIDIWAPNRTEAQSNLENTKSSEQIISSNKPDLNFYPEGGHLVENLTSRIAFKIKNESYHNAQISGYITDDENTIISYFKTLDLGLGLFYITPSANKTYYANVEINGSKYKYRLPKALPVGYCLSATYKANNLLIDVNTSIKKGLSGSYLILHQRGEILFNKLISENKNSYSFKLSANDLKDGVVHVTLFNDEGNPVSERLIFIENEKNQAKIEIKNSKDYLGTREKLSITLNVEDFNTSNIDSYLSLSVKNLNTALNTTTDSKNIKTWLLLNSDLRGEIKNPSYFFPERSDFRKQYLLDLVMMTNGWRRFSWQNLLYDKNENDQFKVEKGITISGTTKLLKKPYKLTPAYTSLTFFGGEVSVQPIQKSDIDGKFCFGPFEFYDSIPVIIQSRLNDFKSKDDGDRELSISIDKANKSPKIIKNTSSKTYKNDTINYLKVVKYVRAINYEYKNLQKLDEVVVIAKKKAEKDAREKEMDDMSKYGFPSHRLDIESNTSLSNLTVISLLGQLPGLSFNGINFSVRGSNGNPRIIFDDIDVDLEDITNIPANQISFIDFYIDTNSAIFSNAANGVISIYSRRGNSVLSRNVKRKPGILNYMAKGFYTAKEFYSTDYSIETNENTRTDVRTTLYWNPKIRITDQNTTKEISFFTGDIKGAYRIEVEGISDSGIPLYQTRTFYVE